MSAAMRASMPRPARSSAAGNRATTPLQSAGRHLGRDLGLPSPWAGRSVLLAGQCGTGLRCRARPAACRASGAARDALIDYEFPAPLGAFGSSSSADGQAARLRCIANGTESGSSTAVSTSLPPGPGAEESMRAEQRLCRLEALVALRRLYRSIMSADHYLGMEVEIPERAIEILNIKENEKGEFVREDSPDEGEEYEDIPRELVTQTQRMVGQLQKMSEVEVKLLLLYRSLEADDEYGFKVLFEDHDSAQAQIEERVDALVSSLKSAVDSAEGEMPYDDIEEAEQALQAVYSMVGPELLGRLMDAERNIGERLKGLKGLRPGERLREIKDKPVESGREAVSSLEGLWIRLNGGQTGGGTSSPGPEGVPSPISAAKAVAESMAAAQGEIDRLDKELRDATKARDAVLRQAGGVLGRAKLAKDIRNLDDQVSELRRQLAVCSLSLEMERMYAVLEDEAQELSVDMRTDDEVALLVAEFGILDEQLAFLRALAGRGEGLLISDDQLASLATEVPDLKDRLGVIESGAFEPISLSWAKLKQQGSESVVKIKEGGIFYLRGCKLMVADLRSTVRLFARAIRGGSLRPREVLVLRRTFRDILTFIPFVVILITPLTPLGHVLVFGFLQKYFPGFFPSQFSNRRQELFIRYEDLESQMKMAELEAMSEADALEFRRKAAQLAEAAAEGMGLSSSGDSAGGGGGGGGGGGSEGGALAAAGAAGAGGGGRGRRRKGPVSEGELPAERRLRQLELQAARAAGQAFISNEGDDERKGGGGGGGGNVPGH